MRNTGSIVGTLALVVLLVLVIGGFGMMGFGGFGMMGGGGMMRGFGYTPFGPIGWILSLAFWALIIAGAVLVVLWLVRNAGGSSTLLPRPSETPLDILRTRYAKGEISKEQFDQMRRDLGT